MRTGPLISRIYTQGENDDVLNEKILSSFPKKPAVAGKCRRQVCIRMKVLGSKLRLNG